MNPPVCRKAVIPAAGFGTRFLPFTRAVPKELIPLVDKPVIQYVVEEAAASGITDVLIVLSTGKEAIPAHFNPADALEARLREGGKSELLAQLRQIDRLVNLQFVYQRELDGLGGAVRLGRAFAAGEPFAVLLGDTVVEGDGTPATAQLLAAYRETGASTVALERIPREKTRRYGVIAGTSADGRLYRLSSLVEKPDPADAPSDLAIASRYVFTPEIFDCLDRIGRGKGNEYQLTDAMRAMLDACPMYGLRIAGRRYDVGDKLEFLKNTVLFGLRRPEFREEFSRFLLEVAEELKGR